VIPLDSRATAGAPGTTAWLLGLATIVWAVVVDQGTKVWADASAGGVEILHNQRSALGVLGGSAPVLILGTLAVLGVFVAVVVPLAFRLGLPAWIPGLVLGGALSNMIDRARFGGVRDFIATRWAVINVADLFVIAGVLILPALLLTRSWRAHQRSTA
jgi:signal peptidase II